MDSCLPEYFYSMDQNFIKQIKTVCFLGWKMLIVTKSDEIFGFGHLPDASQYGNIYELRPIHALDGKLIKKFVFGYNFVIALTEKGELFSWGENKRGQLGLGHLNNIDIPTEISTLPHEQEPVDVACGSEHAMVLYKNYSAYEWGLYSTSNPKLILEDEIITGITCSSYGLFVLTSKGEVFGKGRLFSNDLSPCKYTIGNGYLDTHICEWTKINSLNNIVKIAAGRCHIIALNGDGTVFVWGSNLDGQLTNAIPKYQSSPVKLPNISKKFIDIATNSQTDLSAAIAEDLEIYIWGKPSNVQIGEPIIVTLFNSFDEVFAKLSDPNLSLEPVVLNTKERSKNSTSRSLQSIFDVQDDSDFTISVEGKNIFVHKVILKMNSEYFKAMFAGDWKECNKKVLKIFGYSYKSFRSFLSYLYTGEIDVTSENVFELMNIADRYSDETLLTIIEKEITNSSVSKDDSDVFKIVKEIMKLSPLNYEKFCNGMKKFMSSPTSELVD